jgi:hypothetical protein
MNENGLKRALKMEGETISIELSLHPEGGEFVKGSPRAWVLKLNDFFEFRNPRSEIRNR